MRGRFVFCTSRDPGAGRSRMMSGLGVSEGGGRGIKDSGWQGSWKVLRGINILNSLHQ